MWTANHTPLRLFGLPIVANRRRKTARVSLHFLNKLFVAGFACCGLFSCSGSASADVQSLKGENLSWEYKNTPIGPLEIQVYVPSRISSQQRFPVLIALHGMGEARKGVRRGSKAWFQDYQLERVIDRLKSPPLRVQDFGGYVETDRLRAINERLASQPYQGLIIVCPYTPLRFAGGRAYVSGRAFSSFLRQTLLPRIRRETPALSPPASVGIDGVSLGGRASLLTGFSAPGSFGAIASLQAAFDKREIPKLAKLAQKAEKESPQTKIRLLTSKRDVFLGFHRSFGKKLRELGVAHQLRVVAGTHSYAFNRGPGAIEMLMFHDRTLRQGTTQ